MDTPLAELAVVANGTELAPGKNAKPWIPSGSHVGALGSGQVSMVTTEGEKILAEKASRGDRLRMKATRRWLGVVNDKDSPARV